MARSSFPTRPMRYQLLPILTILVAGLWAGACWWQARRVETVNTARLFGMAFGGSAVTELEDGPADAPSGAEENTEIESSGPIRSPLFPGLQLEGPRPSQEEDRAIRRLQEQIGYTEVVVFVWKRAMFGVAGLVGLVGLIGLVTSFVRGPHLFAAVVMLAAMVTTLVGMRLLQSPDGGGLPRLSVWSHVIVGVGMSGYPLVIILLFARKPRPARPAVAGWPP